MTDQAKRPRIFLFDSGTLVAFHWKSKWGGWRMVYISGNGNCPMWSRMAKTKRRAARGVRVAMAKYAKARLQGKPLPL